MSQPLPDRPTIVGQPSPLAGWPTLDDHRAELVPYQSADLIPVDDRRVVGYERYAGMLVPVYESRQLPAIQPLPPQRHGIDPMAQRMLYGGVGTGAAAAGVGWGLGEAAAGLSSGGGLLLLCLLAAWKLSSSRGQGNTHITQTVHHHNRWFGKSTTNL